ncbi:MAG TPA: lasso peptide biosynthesis B2 protein [Pyrinomonadaceae bacterium]|nr:lasso peptide biosynthesis B2 protein [Pyrinomonadaceae bacterium]
MLNKVLSKIRTGCRLAKLGAVFVVKSPREAWLLIRMATWVVVITALMRIQPLPRVLALATPRRVFRQSVISNQRMAELLDLLLDMDIFVFTPTCWKRAAVLYRYVSMNGTSAQIVFGVRKEGDGILNGHAWLESARKPILEKDPPLYRPTYSFPS